MGLLWSHKGSSECKVAWVTDRLRNLQQPQLMLWFSLSCLSTNASSKNYWFVWNRFYTYYFIRYFNLYLWLIY